MNELELLQPQKLHRLSLEEKENLVEQGFVVAAVVLKSIYNKGQYKREYGTWKNYIKIRWGYSESWYYRLQDSIDVTNNLKLANCQVLPINIGQTRELAPLSDEDQVRVWSEVFNKCPNPKDITAKKIKETIKETLYLNGGVKTFEVEKKRKISTVETPASIVIKEVIDEANRIKDYPDRFDLLVKWLKEQYLLKQKKTILT